MMAVMASIGLYAQLKTEHNRQKVKTTPVKLVPAVKPSTPAPTDPPINKGTAGTIPSSVYALTSVRVKIKTGNDNKEFPSQVQVTLMARSTPNNWRNYIQISLSNEMRINSETEFGLNVAGPPVPLETFQQAGLKFSLTYIPNFFADAWKIEGITLVLEFKDQHGNLHPTLGSKTIYFSNAYGFLNDQYRYIDCYTDASLTPMTSTIRKIGSFFNLFTQTKRKIK
jgi:hypothetical protein